MPTFLHVFDFDGTLFKSPSDTPANRQKFEKSAGVPWLIDKDASRRLSKKLGKHVPVRRGWWGRAETLEPPLVPNPAPNEWFIKSVVKDLFESKNDDDVVTIILTGRHAGLRQAVLRICAQGGLIDAEIKEKNGSPFYIESDQRVKLGLLGENGPLHGKESSYPWSEYSLHHKPSETFPWKVWIIHQYLLLHPEIEVVGIWEDRQEHVEQFRALNGHLADRVVVHHVTE